MTLDVDEPILFQKLGNHHRSPNALSIWRKGFTILPHCSCEHITNTLKNGSIGKLPFALCQSDDTSWPCNANAFLHKGWPYSSGHETRKQTCIDKIESIIRKL